MKRQASATSEPATLDEPAAPRRVPARAEKATARAARVGLGPTRPGLSTVDKIVEAAAEFFGTHGYVSSTLDDVAALAGFTKGAVYYYFKDKEGLLLEVLKRLEQRSIDNTAARVRELDGSATARLEAYVRHQTGWAAEHPLDLAMLMVVTAETANTSERVREQMRGFYRKLEGLLEEIIEEGKHSGEFSHHLDTRDTVLYLQAAHDGNMMIWYRSGLDPEIGHRLAKATLTGFLKMVRD